MQTTSITLLAVVTSGPFTSLIKIGIVVLLLLGWAAAAQWVDRDTDVVKTRREQWNLIVVSGAAVASLVLFVVPVWRGSFFVVGVLVWVALAGGAILAYLVHRNGRMQPDARVLTPGHFKRMLKRSGSNKPKDTGSRVRLADHAGDHVEFPADADDALSYRVVQDFLFDLISRRASSADLVPGKERYRLVYRVDGVRTETPEGMPTDDGERAIRYLKKLAGLNVEEIRRPQVGRIEAALLSSDGKMGKTAVRTSGTTAGESLRLTMEADAKVMRLAELGLAKPRLAALTKILNKQTGLFLVSSPSENGLTTTQYAIIRSHDAYMNNIHAIERRPLAKLDNITQTTYEGNNADVNYARMLQTVLRREPDIVLVGECEDRETALIASRAAADDRKIYMGIDAKDSFDALNKYLSFLGDNKLAAKAVAGVMCQRLIRVLCDDCREAFEPDAGTLKKLNLPADKIDRFYRPPTEKKLDRKGREILCPTCQGTGYVGRTGVFELLVVDDAVKKLIEAGAPIDRIKAQSRKNRMYYLQETGLLKVIDGKTSMNEILRCLRTGDK